MHRISASLLLLAVTGWSAAAESTTPFIPGVWIPSRGLQPGTTDVNQNPAATVTPNLTYGSSSWGMYGHDMARSGLSDGAVTTNLSYLWSYKPSATRRNTNRNLYFTAHAVATSSYVWVGWAGSVPGLPVSPGVGVPGSTGEDMLNASNGGFIAYHDTVDQDAPKGTDSNLCTWPTLTGDKIIDVNDGIVAETFYAENGNPPMTHTFPVDSQFNIDTWGDGIWDGSRLAFSSTFVLDNPNHMGLSAIDNSLSDNWLTSQSPDQHYAWEYPTIRNNSCDKLGGTAEANGVVFYAPNYSGGVTGSWLFGFNASTGYQAFTQQQAVMISKISCDNSRVFDYEYVGAPYNQYVLTGRSQSTGATIWGSALNNGSRQAPIVTNTGLVILSAADNIYAFHASTGAIAWAASPAVPNTNVQDLSYVIELSGITQAPWSPVTGSSYGGYHIQPSTLLAAASSTHTHLSPYPGSLRI